MLLPLWLLFGTPTYAQTYETLWKQTETAVKKGQPKTAKTAAEKIYQKAEAEGNFPWLIKSYTKLMHLNMDMSADSFKVDIQHLEKMLDEREGTCDAAVLHTLLGSFYKRMKERSYSDAETYEKYNKLSDEHYAKAMADKTLLADTKADKYVPLVELHTDSKLYDNDMLSVIAMFMDENGKYDPDGLYSMYDSLSTFYAERSNRNASLLMKLRALQKKKYVKDKRLRISEEEYQQTLLRMAEENKDIETGADIYRDLLLGWKGTNSEQLDIARKALKLYPNSVHCAFFKKTIAEVQRPQLQIYTDQEFVTGVPFPIYVTNRNLSQSILTLTEKKSGKVVERRTIKLEKAIESKTDTVYLTIPKAGKYILKAESQGKSDKTEFNVTTLRLFAVMLPDNTLQCTVADNITGRPVPNCSVQAEYRDSQNRKLLVKNGRTDSLGIVNLGHEERWNTVHAIRNANDMTSKTHIGYFSGTESNDRSVESAINIFTDRSIYRPGQTVKTMVLLHEKDKDNFYVLKQKSVKLTLYDANSKEISSKEVTTNDMGTASADFIIPQGRLNGNYFIKAENGSRCHFKVEEYKRPTFSVEMSIARNGSETTGEHREYTFGDSLDIEGSAMTFSGAEVQNARVKYRVEYANRYFWYRYRNWTMEYDGELTTDTSGHFTIPVFLDENNLENDECIFAYRITTEVTNMGGETQTAEYILPVSKKGFGLNPYIPKNIDRNDMPELKVKAINMHGEEVNAEGKWEVYHIYNHKTRTEGTTDALYSDKREREKVAEGEFVCGKPIDTNKLKMLVPGSYIMKATATDSHGNNIESESEFVLFDTHAEHMEVADDWLYATTTEFGPESSTDIYFMPKQNDTYIYYYVFANRKLIDTGHKESVGNIVKFHFDYKEEYGEALTLQIFYVKNGKTYSQQKDITLKVPEKKLSLQWKTFRDKLQPGQKEEWTLTVNGADGKPSHAELLAVLYDASLEKLNSHNWDLNLNLFRATPFVRSTQTDNNYFNVIYITFPRTNMQTKERSFTLFDNMFRYGDEVFYCLDEVSMRRKMSTVSGIQLAAGITNHCAVVKECASITETEADEGGNAEEMPDSNQPLRSNFAETAFFYPHLMTDNNGEVSISFTLPESLTEWKFMGLAHTDEVDYGKITAEIVAHKDFMVQPNMPRFVRTGDHATIATQIINKSDTDISGTAVFELTDPETGKTVYKATKKFSVGKGETASVDFNFNVSEKYPLLVCRISAGNKTFSDGERNYLPVLTDKKHITETVPFFIDNAGTKNIDLSGMFNGGSDSATEKQMTIEYSDSPGWTVIQSLKSISDVNNNNAISLSAALYANYAIKTLADSNPSLQDMAEAWKKDGISSKSNLEKNEELKDILLQESPWMTEATNETEQMMMLSDLFDRNIMDSRISTSTERLARLQNTDGSWSWFNGMEGSYHVTATVVEHLAQLSKLTQTDNKIQDLIIKGYKYLDHKELENYRLLKKNKQEVKPSESTMRYLYISSLVKHNIESNVRQMQQDYIGKIEKDINSLTIYGRANIACVLNVWGKTEAAKDFVKSLREYTVYKPEMGRYYDTDKARYSWMDYRIPTHIAAMKAMRLMGADFNDTDDYLNNMTLWLIRQKQTQCWDNPINTVNAVNELLQADGNAIIHHKAEAKFLLNGKALDDADKKANDKQQTTPTAWIGYEKIAVPEKMIGKKNSELTVVKKSEGISWGAVYGQYLEQFDKISGSNGSLAISRKMYREETVDGKKQWTELHEGSPLAVGDKIRIRHIITADRDMDFVQVHSQFAACMEPLDQISGYRRLSDIGFSRNGCYIAIHDASADIFFDTFHKGSSTVDIEVFVNRKGTYGSGIATVQCAYSTEFTGHSNSHAIEVK